MVMGNYPSFNFIATIEAILDTGAIPGSPQLIVIKYVSNRS